MNTRRRFSIGALAALGVFSGVQRAWAQCSYVFLSCVDHCLNNCWGCGQVSYSVWQDSAVSPNINGYCFYCNTGCTPTVGTHIPASAFPDNLGYDKNLDT